VIGRLHHVILDGPDPRHLAAFYSALLGQPVTHASEDFAVVAADDTSSGLGFQRAPDHQPPGAGEQQVHLDVMVEDPVLAGQMVQQLGATHLRDDVYLDPAGHPFCLIPRPGWAAPLEA
jgi:catechol 2,3-dioxygenase-like lactoylglutathione lyase family enzyme